MWFFIVFIVLHSTTALSPCDVCVCRMDRAPNVTQHVIDCSRKNIDITKNYTIPNDINFLDLSFNNLNKLPNTTILRSKTVIELYLNDNDLKEIGPVINMPELKRLDLSYNDLETIHEETFRNLRKLEYLNLASNKFTTFEKLTFHHLSNLKEIILDNNAIGNSLRKVDMFDLNGFGLTKTIKSISIRGVKLNKVPDNFFIEAYDLRKIVLSDNNLTDTFEIPFTLEYLDLSDNPITYLDEEDFFDLIALKVLKLNNLQIKEISGNTFKYLLVLKELELERNHNLTKFSKFAFGRIILDDAIDLQLERLSLKNSRLTTLDEELIEPFGKLLKLDLQGNPWRCDCSIAWLKKLQISPVDYDHVRCATPKLLYGARIFDLQSESFTCATSTEHHYIGLTIAGVAFVAILTFIALWFFVFVPKYQSRCGYEQSIFATSTAYTILPMASRVDEIK